jgi:hypothetical protein
MRNGTFTTNTGKSCKRTASLLLSAFQAPRINIQGWVTQNDANMAVVLRAIDALLDG